MSVNKLKSRAGQLLYRELPEEYRYQDHVPSEDELGDLEAYLHSFGHLFDLIRNTTEQAYADAFAEAADNGREIQTWLIPYLAELVGAQLRAPDPDARRDELSETVSWYKSKGTLQTVDDIADVICQLEAVVVEGWRHTLTTPRMSLPPFSTENTRVDTPLGTPDLRYNNRAVEDPAGNNPLYLITSPTRDVFGRVSASAQRYWKPKYRTGAPCFPNAFDDTSARTPDVCANQHATGPHPKRTLIHVQPPHGFFAEGINGPEVSPTTAHIVIDEAQQTEQRIGPEQIFAALGLLEDDVIDQLKVNGQLVFPERVLVTGDITLPANVNVGLEGLMITGTVRITDPSTTLRLDRCAIANLIIEVPAPTPSVVAKDCLFDTIQGGTGFAQLEYCTVMQETLLERLWASDCIFNGELIDISCSGGETCIRYSRLPNLHDLQECGADKLPSNTDNDPNFIRLWFRDGDECVLRPARFGEPGAGVLNLTSSESIRFGSENEGEMGAYHHLFYAAQIRALQLKLTDYLPYGQDVVIKYDPHLARLPAQTI